MADPRDGYKVVDLALTRAQAASWERLVKLYPELRAVQADETDERWAQWHAANKEKNIPYYVGEYRKAAAALATYEQQQNQLPEQSETKQQRRQNPQRTFFGSSPPNEDRLAIAKASAANKWESYAKKYPKINELVSQKEFSDWQKDHPDMPLHAWSYRKYHYARLWKEHAAKHPELSALQTPEQFAAWQSLHPEVKSLSWQHKLVADTHVSTPSPKTKNAISRLSTTESSVKANKYAPSPVQKQTLTPEMAFYKKRHEQKTSKGLLRPEPAQQHTSNASIRTQFANPKAKALPQPQASPTYASPPHPPTGRDETKHRAVQTEPPKEWEEIKHPVLGPQTPAIQTQQNFPEEENEDDDDERKEHQQLRRRGRKRQGYEKQPSGKEEPFREGRPSVRSVFKRTLSKARPVRQQATSAITKAGKKLVSGAGRMLARSLTRIGTQLAARGAVAVAAATSEVWVPALLIALAVLVIIIVIVVIIMLLTGGASTTQAPGILTITLSSQEVRVDPTDTSRFSVNINYKIDVSYTGEADDIIVRNPIPENAAFVGAQEPYTRTDTEIRWSLRELLSSTASSSGSTGQSADFSKYTQPPYSLPSPSDQSVTFPDSAMPRMNNLGNLVAKYQSYIISKVSNSDLRYADPFLSVIWTGGVEGIGHRDEFWVGTNPYFWNCQDTSTNINTGCSGGYYSGGWQVGYGIQVSQAANHLAADFNAAYGAGSADNPDRVQQVGQAVISNSNGKITNPSSFPRRTVPDIVTQANSGDASSQQALAILLMDPQVGAITVALEIAADIASRDNWRATMEGWGSYYSNNMQGFVNRANAIAKKYTGAASRGVGSGKLVSPRATISLTLRPLTRDVNVINQAFAEVIGGTVPISPAVGIDSGTNSEPNQDACDGYYPLSAAGHNGDNFGDATCELANSSKTEFIFQGTTYSVPQLLLDQIQQLDSANTGYWVGIASCEAPGFDTNNVSTAVNGGAYGLFQMGTGGHRGANGEWIDEPYKPGDGNNGPYDRGDVPWRQQVSNAINYNRQVLGGSWEYWECAKLKFSLW